jgi:hypothetical protein
MRNPNVRGAFLVLSLRHDRGALVRAVLEGVAYGLRDSLELLRELGAEPTSAASPAAARGAGCGARSSPRCSISRSRRQSRKRDRHTAPPSSPALPTACSPSRRTRSTAAWTSRRTNPDPTWVEAHADWYARFRRLYPTLARSGDGSAGELERAVETAATQELAEGQERDEQVPGRDDRLDSHVCHDRRPGRAIDDRADSLQPVRDR